MRSQGANSAVHWTQINSTFTVHRAQFASLQSKPAAIPFGGLRVSHSETHPREAADGTDARASARTSERRGLKRSEPSSERARSTTPRNAGASRVTRPTHAGRGNKHTRKKDGARANSRRGRGEARERPRGQRRRHRRRRTREGRRGARQDREARRLRRRSRQGDERVSLPAAPSPPAPREDIYPLFLPRPFPAPRAAPPAPRAAPS